MVSSIVDRVKVFLGIDTKEAEMDLERVKQKADVATRAAVQARHEAAQTAAAVASLGINVLSLTKSLSRAMGITISAVGEALLNMVQGMIVTAQAYFKLQAALQAGSGGLNVLAWTGMVAAAASLAISVAAFTQVMIGNQKAQEQASRLDSVLGSLEGTISSLGGIF